MTPLFMDYYGNMHSGRESNRRARWTCACCVISEPRLHTDAARLNSVSRCGEFSSRIRVTQEKHSCHDPTNPIDFISLSPLRSFVVSRKKFLDTLLVNRSALLNLIFSCATNSREFISSFREFQADCSLSRIWFDQTVERTCVPCTSQ